MKRKAILLTVLCLFAVTFARVASAQQITNAKVAGTWTATIHTPDKTVTEMWTLKQDGNKVTGTAKTDKGDLPITGTIEGGVVRGLETDGDMHNQVHLDVDGSDADGTIRIGKNEFLIDMKKKS